MSVPRERISATLKNLNSTQDSIKEAAKFMRNFSGQANDVANIFHEEINKAPLQNKLLIIYVMHEIMTDSKDRNFVVSFGNISKTLFTDVAESINDKAVLGKCLKIFGVWEKEFLFKKEFIQKLSAIIQNKINILDGIKPQEASETRPHDLSPNQKNYSKAFMRDYSNVKENPLAKVYYERKILESQYSKHEERIMEISNLVKDMDKYRDDPNYRDKMREAIQFLKKAQDQYHELLLNTTDYMCTLAQKIEADTRKWISTNYDKYEAFEKQIQRRKELFE